MSWLGLRKMKPGLRPRPIRTKDRAMRNYTEKPERIYKERKKRQGKERNN